MEQALFKYLYFATLKWHWRPTFLFDIYFNSIIIGWITSLLSIYSIEPWYQWIKGTTKTPDFSEQTIFQTPTSASRFWPMGSRKPRVQIGATQRLLWHPHDSWCESVSKAPLCEALLEHSSMQLLLRPCFGRRIGLDDPQRSLPNPYHSVILLGPDLSLWVAVPGYIRFIPTKQVWTAFFKTGLQSL